MTSTRGQRVILLLGACLASALVVAHLQVVLDSTRRVATDFGLFYHGLLAQRAGGSFYDVTVASHWPKPFANDLLDLAPPHLHLLLWPLMPLPYGAAFAAWVLLNTAAFALSVRLITRELGIAWTRSTACWFVVGVLAPPLVSLSTIAHGQYVWLLTLPLTLAWIDLRHERWVRAFGWLGLVLSAKPFPAAMVVYALWHRQFRAPLAMLGTALACAAAGTVAFGASVR